MATLYSDNFNDGTMADFWVEYEGGYGDSNITEENGHLEIDVTYTNGIYLHNWAGIYQDNIDEYIDARIKIESLTDSTSNIDGEFYVGYFSIYNKVNHKYYEFNYYDIFYEGIHSRHLVAYGENGNQEIDDPGTPLWLRITYGGRIFRFYYSTNGTDWTKMYQEAYTSTPDLRVLFELGTDSTDSGNVFIIDDFVAAEMSADPEPLPYGLHIYKNNQLQFDLDSGLKYIVYTKTVLADDSGSQFIPITGDRRYLALSFAKDYGKTEHEAKITNITSSGITLTWTASSVGNDSDGTFRGMPSGDSIIYVMGY